MKVPSQARAAGFLLIAAVVAALVGSGAGSSAEPVGQPAAGNPLAAWQSGVKVSPVSGKDHHSMHSYFNTTPESPDGRWVLFYASTAADGQTGELRVRERATGKETVLARDISCEDAHRVACQQWVSGGRRVAYHAVRKDGEWVVMCVDLKTGDERLLAKGRQLCFGQPNHDVVPLYGPHWKPGDHTGLELLNVETGKIEQTALTPDAIRRAYPEWVKKNFGDKPISVFFPILSPDLTRVFFKVATPAGGDFRSTTASVRLGLFCYDLRKSEFVFMNEKWGHPAWHPDSRSIIETSGRVFDGTGKVSKIPDTKLYSGDHPSFSPDGKLFVVDTTTNGEPFNGDKATWAVVVGDVRTGKRVVLHQFDNSKGARSWRVSHPHPAFSPDGKRIYFNVSDGQWTRLHVAEVAP
jgi:Tol biopolymer transport system component